MGGGDFLAQKGGANKEIQEGGGAVEICWVCLEEWLW